MSLLRRNRISAFLSPHRVELVRLQRHVKSGQSERQVAACERADEGTAWGAALAQLKRMLPTGTGAEIHILLSNHFVRYAVIPPQSKIETPVELRAYAAFQMREIYGERTGGWELTTSSWDPATGVVCAAIEHGFLQGLEELAASQRMKLKYVEPYFTSVFDHWHDRFDKGRAWFALVETGRLCLALLEGGAWLRILNQRILDDVKEELLVALEREALLFSAPAGTSGQVYLFAPEHPGLTLPEGSGWQVVPLGDKTRPAPAPYPFNNMTQTATPDA
ncbi:hypothetical protein [Nitrosospira multiformis]|uniref:Uncharacterized protein n=1 Tax=Nitrosospira multiformis TaxID=1231 RepID=A0A1I7HSE5_9PROT|nr:hypothetical protein [Nitrosospira multiformis]SFU63611.1 hypothetical protein SAMN05216417_11177 [Nitrosospira multiformis]